MRGRALECPSCHPLFKISILCKRMQRYFRGTQNHSLITVALHHLTESQEGKSRIIHLKEEDPVLVKQLLTACYSCDYDGTVGDDNPMCFNARMYAAADRYQIPFLKTLAKSQISSQLLNKFNQNSHLLPVIHIIYTTTPTSDIGLRGLLTPIFQRYEDRLYKDDLFVGLIKSGFADGELAMDVIAALQPTKNTYRCLSCDDAVGIKVFCESCGQCMGFCEQTR